MKVAYIERRFSAKSEALIEQANDIIADYQAQGFSLTLRQLYYQFVARGLLANSDRNYKNLGSVINDGRLAGLIDWNAIEDRTRFVRSLSHWGSPQSIVDACASQFRLDMWQTQKYRPEVWIEKDALVGVFEPVCNTYDVPLFSCRGYVSQSELWGAANRLLEHVQNGQTPIIFHFGDHDPSGIDMTRDIEDRLRLFMGTSFDDFDGVQRLALTMAQVREVNPPPNPAKMTDSRHSGYVDKYGTKSWELDALDPKYLSRLVGDAIAGIVDRKKWSARQKEQEKHRENLAQVAKRWKEVVEGIDA